MGDHPRCTRCGAPLAGSTWRPRLCITCQLAHTT